MVGVGRNLRGMDRVERVVERAVEGPSCRMVKMSSCFVSRVVEGPLIRILKRAPWNKFRTGVMYSRKSWGKDENREVPPNLQNAHDFLAS